MTVEPPDLVALACAWERFRLGRDTRLSHDGHTVFYELMVDGEPTTVPQSMAGLHSPAHGEIISALLARVHVLEAALAEACDCNSAEKNPPRDWTTNARIPHHCDCPMFPFELPDENAAPVAHAAAVAERVRLMGGKS